MTDGVLEKIEKSLEQLADNMEQGFKSIGERLSKVEKELKGSEFGGEDGLSGKVKSHDKRIAALEMANTIEKAKRNLLAWLITPAVSIVMAVLTSLILKYVTG